jgi:hypothetical protein
LQKKAWEWDLYEEEENRDTYRLKFFFLTLVCEAIGTAATPGLLCQPWVIVKINCGEADGM